MSLTPLTNLLAALHLPGVSAHVQGSQLARGGVLWKAVSSDHLGVWLWAHPFLWKLLCRWAGLRVNS